MLEERLNPILTQLRVEKQEEKVNFKIVKNWFQEHKENLAKDLGDMTFICELPRQERTLLAHPVMGNWYLDKLSEFDFRTNHQQKAYGFLKNLILERRFSNGHMKEFYDNSKRFNMMVDEVNGILLENPAESLYLSKSINRIHKEICDAVYKEKLLNKDTYTTDLGHGLVGPSDSFNHLMFNFNILNRINETKQLDSTIMVVDDECPEEWYQRMISVGFGFKNRERQQGYFFDCESALKALKNGKYDVILTDLELGDGKIGGIEFFEKAYSIQKIRNIKPIISIFSYNDKKLKEAEKRLIREYGEKENFNSLDYIKNKAEFTAIQFRQDVSFIL